jgi:hypothetical protein
VSAVFGTYKQGRIELDEPVDWPDGMRVEVLRADEYGLPEKDWPKTPEELAAWAAEVDALEPLEITPDDEAEIAAAREAVRGVTP